MTRVALLVLALTAVCHAILPEIVHSDFVHILEDNSAQGHTELDRFVEVKQLPEDPQQKPEDAFHQVVRQCLFPFVNETVSCFSTQETNNISTSVHSGDPGNNIEDGCISDGDCMKGSYCLYDTSISKCLHCKAIDMSCTKDNECCAEQLCVWGQCSLNATKGEAGSTCQHQTDCSPDLCCLFHKALLFPVCSSKPIERESCFGASNHLVELLSWDIQDEGPRKHCPCAGDLHCQHLGRGSMCLKGEDSSEEDLTDSLYSEIDYII
uniref:Dickkopf WNT signaling pathway inhibitor 3a n=1 Tax=Cyclopterus lumpus TaxID=8103 RepID=A0A8C2ZPU3_CYCLU